MISQSVPIAHADGAKVTSLCARLRASDHVKPSVKEKADHDLLTHYGLRNGDVLTNLGVLLVGGQQDRAGLGSAPVVHAIKYDENGVKIAEWSWNDHEMSPIEVVDAIWNAVPDFRESYELPDGMLRTKLPAYDELVVRELLVNALVYRPYTQRGDVYLNLYPDRLEVVNPGRLPSGVTPRNILHQSRRRNDGLARIFHDLKLMELEGSGIDMVFERLLATGRRVPTIREDTDSVHVTVPRRVVQPGMIKLLVEAGRRHQLTQRERITFAGISGSSCMSRRVSTTDNLLFCQLIPQCPQGAPQAPRTCPARASGSRPRGPRSSAWGSGTCSGPSEPDGAVHGHQRRGPAVRGCGGNAGLTGG